MKEARELRVNDNNGNTLLYADLSGNVLVEAHSLKIKDKDGNVKCSIGDDGIVYKGTNDKVSDSPKVIVGDARDDIKNDIDYWQAKIKSLGDTISGLEYDTHSQVLRCLYSKVEVTLLAIKNLIDDIKREKDNAINCLNSCYVDFFPSLIKINEEVVELVTRLENYAKWDLNIDRMHNIDIPSVDEVPDEMKEIISKFNARLEDVRAFGDKERPKVALKINSLVVSLEDLQAQYNLLVSAKTMYS